MRNSIKNGTIFLYLLFVLMFFGAVYLTNGIAPQVYLPSLSDPIAAPTIIQNATLNGGFYKLNTTPPVSTNNQQLQLEPAQGIPLVSCGDTAAAVFLIDVSGSMAYNGKEQSLISGLQSFAGNFPSKGVLGAVTFSDYQLEQIPPTTFSLAQNKFTSLISNLPNIIAVGGNTATRNAFNFVYDMFANEPDVKALLSNRKFNFIFISDGMPEQDTFTESCALSNTVINTSNPICNQYCHNDANPPFNGRIRCFDINQDPTNSNLPGGNIADSIKNLGVTIYTIAFPDDTSFKDQQLQMMKSVASSPSDAQTAPNSNDLTDIIKNITTMVCK